MGNRVRTQEAESVGQSLGEGLWSTLSIGLKLLALLIPIAVALSATGILAKGPVSLAILPVAVGIGFGALLTLYHSIDFSIDF